MLCNTRHECLYSLGPIDRYLRVAPGHVTKRQDETLGSMSGMLDALLDLNQIEAGIVKAELKDCRIGAVLHRLCTEFTYAAHAKGIRLHAVPCSAMVRTDPRLLEQMLRNLVANAVKYTDRGRVLLGCRRRGSTLQIEIWDTGMGIPGGELQAVFDEYHQIGNEARERERGLGQLLQGEGHEVQAAPDGQTAVGKCADPSFQPDLVIADYNLPGGMTGLQVASRLRESLTDVPVIILTGDISARTLQEVTRHGHIQLSKPVKSSDLIRTVDELLLPPPEQQATQSSSGRNAHAGAPVIFIVDDDKAVRAALRTVLEDDGRVVEDYSGSQAFLAAFGTGRSGRNACLLVDAAMPGIDGLELLERLTAAGHNLPAIVVTGHGDVAMAVRAMKAGALDFIEKPVRAPELLASVAHALDHSRDSGALAARHTEAAANIAGLAPRQLDVMGMVLAGHPSKNIAADLGISQRTVENHRASIMRKTGARSLPALARLALTAARPGSAA